MAEIENTGKVEQFSAKLTKETKEILASLKDSGDFNTWNQLFETLVERYNAPIKAKNETEKIKSLELEVSDLKVEISSLIIRLEKSNEVSSKADGIYHANKSIADKEYAAIVQEKDELEQQLIKAVAKNEIADEHTLIKLDKINLAILKFVAKREGDARKQDWQIDDVVNYFVHFRFEKGKMNGDLKSVPDSVIAELKNELTNKEE